MTRTLALSARQVTAICKGAAKAGFIAEVQIGDAIVRLMPASGAGSNFDPDNPDTFETFEQYSSWRDRQQPKSKPKGGV